MPHLKQDAPTFCTNAFAKDGISVSAERRRATRSSGHWTLATPGFRSDLKPQNMYSITSRDYLLLIYIKMRSPNSTETHLLSQQKHHPCFPEPRPQNGVLDDDSNVQNGSVGVWQEDASHG